MSNPEQLEAAASIYLKVTNKFEPPKPDSETGVETGSEDPNNQAENGK